MQVIDQFQAIYHEIVILGCDNMLSRLFTCRYMFSRRELNLLNERYAEFDTILFRA